MHTRRPAYLPPQSRLTPRPPGRSWHGSHSRRGGSPQSEGLVRARGHVCFHTPVPAPLGSLPDQQSLRGKAIRAPLRGGGAAVGRPAGGHRRCKAELPMTLATGDAIQARYGAVPSRPEAFLQGTAGPERPGMEGVGDVHIPTLRDARTRHRNPRVSGPRRNSRCGIGAPAGAAELQSFQRYVPSDACTSGWQFSAHRPRCQMHIARPAPIVSVGIRETVSGGAHPRRAANNLRSSA